MCNILCKSVISLDQRPQIFVITHLLAAHLTLINIRLNPEEFLLNLVVITIQDIHMHYSESVKILLGLELIQDAESIHSLLSILLKIQYIHSEIKVSSCNSNLCFLILLLLDMTFLVVTRLLRF